MKVSTVAEMRALDQRAIQQFGITAELLMENAGQAVYFALWNELGIEGKRFVVFCGLGNNGGDGLVVARKVHSSGGSVKVLILGSVDRFTGAAKGNFGIVSRLPIEVRQIGAVEEAASEVDRCDVIVDAVFGTGLIREVVGLHRDVIELINTSHKTVFSVDIPSGVHGDTGQVMGAAVQAHATVTFGLPKIGNLLSPGYVLGGRLYVSHISFPPSLYGGGGLHVADSLKVEVAPPMALSPAEQQGRKKGFGEALFVLGVAGQSGTPCLAALSFLKAGGGRCCLAAPESVGPSVADQDGRIRFVPQIETNSGRAALQNQPALLESSQRADAVVLGPGWSGEARVRQLARELAAAVDRPLILHGDGSAAITGDPQLLQARKADTVVVWSAGEMARATGKSVSEIEGHKVEAVRHTAAELKATVVLEDDRSLVAYADGRVFINTSGASSGPATASGELLAGVIAALLGLAPSVPEAVRKGVFLHGVAEDLATEDPARDGVTADDILACLPLAMQMDRDGFYPAYRERYVAVRVI
jgi:hydroxyethylthiazole kinase-like uncharacterized protein yjeF